LDLVHPNYDFLPIEQRWIFVAGVGTRILLDFSGYSDMAIGFARMMGIRLPENFNWPYIARNIGDFWRRWHISLSTWIRDYIYIPLGGSRHGPVLRACNALIAMALCGLWHGAAWNFALWGVYHGVGVVAVNAMSRGGLPFSNRIARMIEMPESVRKGIAALHWLMSWTVTMIFVHIGWLLFFYPANTAIHMTKLLFYP
jgi:alginate O-acetyltransferase complex protein AlgI